MEITQSHTFAALIRLSTTTHTLLTFNISEISSNYATPNVTKYQRCNFITEIHQFTIKIDKINTNLLFECVKIVEFNLNSHVFHVMYQETTASGNVASMREPLDGSLWWYWIAANAAKKNGASFKITIVLVICSIFVECR